MTWRLPAHPSFSTRRRESFCRRAPNKIQVFFTYIAHMRCVGHRPHTALALVCQGNLCTRTGWSMTGEVQNTCGQPRVFNTQARARDTPIVNCPCGGSLSPRVACVWPRLLRGSALQKSRNLEISLLLQPAICSERISAVRIGQVAGLLGQMPHHAVWLIDLLSAKAGKS
jgi:hypothetical protein